MAQAAITELIYSPEKGRDVAHQTKIDFDPSKYTTIEAAARALHKALCKYAKATGCPESEVSLFSPTRTMQYTGCKQWCVVWESGPYQWAISMSMEIRGPWGFCEPYYSFDLHFTE